MHYIQICELFMCLKDDGEKNLFGLEKLNMFEMFCIAYCPPVSQFQRKRIGSGLTTATHQILVFGRAGAPRARVWNCLEEPLLKSCLLNGGEPPGRQLAPSLKCCAAERAGDLASGAGEKSIQKEPFARWEENSSLLHTQHRKCLRVKKLKQYVHISSASCCNYIANEAVAGSLPCWQPPG